MYLLRIYSNPELLKSSIYIKRNTFLKFCIFALLFLCIYTPPIKVFPFSPLYIIIFISILYSLFRFNAFVSFFAGRNYTLIALQFLVLFVYALIMDVFTNYVNDIPLSRKYVVNILLLAINFFFTSFFFLDLIKRTITTNPFKIIRIFLILSILQSFIVVIMIFFPEFREHVFHNLLSFKDEKIFRPDLWIKRSYGISSQYLFAMPIYQGIGIILAYIFSLKYSFKYLFYIPFLIISILFNARIGIVAMPLIIIIHSSFAFFYLRTKDILKVFKVISIIILVILLLVFIIGKFFDITYFQYTLIWLLETVNEGGNIQNINVLRNHVFLPQKTSEILFGQGRYLTMNSAEIYNSDIGYINYIFFGGLIFSILLYLVIAEISLIAFVKCKSIYEKSIILGLLFLVFIANFKGIAFTSNSFIVTFFLINLTISNRDRYNI